MKRYFGQIFERIRTYVFSLRRTNVYELDCSDSSGTVGTVSVTFRLADAGDLAAFDGIQNGYGKTDLDFCHARLQQGDSFWVGSVEGEPAFSAWLMFGDMDLDWNNMVRLRSDIAYSYKLLTLNHARGRGICGAYYEFLKRYLVPMGYRRIVCRITPGNLPSIRAHTRAGFRQVGVLWRLVIGPCSIYFADAPLREWLATGLAEESMGPGGMLLIAFRILGVS